mmetsp:Transcript_17349/g.31574  ORF Transcript_17349/g.31574 Transcript_17349/m.31574 type:complete len:539 (-) Transcript_17349:253-1869(-)
MGVDFRNGSYVRRVKCGKRTIKAGECAAVWDSRGRHRQVMGPQVVHLWWSTIRFLDRHSATPTQYLSVLHSSGKRETIRGPAVLYENPVLHDSIEVKESIQLKSSSETLVVYTEVSVGTPVESEPTQVDSMAGGLGAEHKEAEGGEDEDDMKADGKGNGSVQLLRTSYASGYDAAQEKSVSRRVLTGPAVFVPKVSEWCHEFVWSGNAHNAHASGSAANGGNGAVVLPGALRFNVLETNARTWSVDATMRTSDNIPFTCQLTFNYKLKSLEHLLASSTDPVAEFWSGLQADMCVLGDHVTSATVLAKGLNVMSTLESFPFLRERMEANGFALNAVILRRVIASEALERRFNAAAAEEADGARRLALAETNLKAAQAKAETEEREAAAREKRDAREAETKEATIRLEMSRREERRQKEHAMEAAQLAHELEITRTKEQSKALYADAQIERQIKFLRELKELDVDITAFLMKQGGADGGGLGGRIGVSAGAGVGAGAGTGTGELVTLVPTTFTFALSDAGSVTAPPLVHPMTPSEKAKNS